ncbi:MAG: haloacid dehalogenase-like hydrolase [Sandaracinaceae bacterium]|nr:haloacid dehalogenase-like hydrolase [Sandaracinaceae bacterium]
MTTPPTIRSASSPPAKYLPPGEVALFRVEGALSPRPTLTAAAWLALNAQRVRTRLLGLSSLALAAPLGMRDPRKAHTLAWSVLEGMSEDRLIVLGEMYAQEHLFPSLSRVGLELLERCRSRDQRVILLSDNLDVIVKPLADALGVGEVLCNSMELARARATGKLRAPILPPEIGGTLLRERLGERGVELSACAAYGSHVNDAVLLGAVALPCAVTPDRELRRMARDLDWPVVEG